MINKGKKMSLHSDCSSALQLLEHIQQSIHKTEDVKLQTQTADDLSMLISVFSNPILRSIVCVEDSLRELDQQLQEHPSILPVDLHVTPSGEISLSVPPADDIFDPHFTTTQEFEDQRVPVAKLSHGSSTDTSVSPQLGSSNRTQPPITTQAYAIEFQKAIEEASRGREVIYVQLFKPDGGSLGFSLVGLHSQEKGDVGIYVSEIQPAGIAGRDGNLHEGDQILAIDGQPLDSNISNQQAISILQQARGRVELVVARGEEPPPSPPSPGAASPVARSPSAVSDVSKAGSDMVLNTEWAQVELIDLVNDGSGLGFGIIGGRSTGVVVKTILPGGVADRDGRLQSGDHILQIGDVNLRGMGSEQVAAVLRQSGSHVRLVVARPVETADYQSLGSSAPIVPTKILTDTEELDRRLMQVGYTQGPVLDGYSDRFHAQDQDLDLMPEACLVLDAAGLPSITMDMLPLQPDALPEMETFSVELKKDLHGLGITIAGYVCEKEELSGIFVKSVSEGSAADLCGRIQVNDRIVEVDGQSLQGYTNHQAVEVLRATGKIVKLSLERYLRGPKFEQLQQAIAASELKPPTPNSPSAASLPRFPVSTDGESTTEIEVEGESHTTIDSVVLEPEDAASLYIDEDYVGSLKPAVEAAIQAKWAKVLGPDTEIIVAQLCKLSEGGGLGISLEGTVDVEHGQEVRPHHYIRSILSEGPVGRNGRLRSGDELLEVNGHRLLGMNHIEVVSILKDLPMSVRMVCARRDGDFNPHRLIDTAQDKTAFAARNILGGSLQNLIPAGDRLVKAKSDGSLASTATATDASFSKLKSRSLEPLTGLAMWSSEPHIIELIKGERGLGFSILDYQDPMNPNETVIVIRSLVPGGVAQVDGQLIPGDRLLSVNDTSLENASLDQAVQALKGAPRGVVRIGVAKPLPIPDSVSQEDVDVESNNTPTVDDHSMFSSCESLSPSPGVPEDVKVGDELEDEEKDLPLDELIEEENEEDAKSQAEESDEGMLDSEDGVLDLGLSTDGELDQGSDVEMDPDLDHGLSTDGELEKSTDDELSGDLLQLMIPVSSEGMGTHRTPSTGDITEDDLEEEESPSAWARDLLHLPPSLEVTIKIHKGTEPLGISVDSVERGVNGMLVVLVVPGGAVARDGRLRPGDYLTSVNHESLRNATNSQTRAILRRTQLLSTDISVTYIPGEASAAYRKLVQNEPVTPPVANLRKTSPRSPYIPSESSFDSSTEERDREPGLTKSASGLTSSSAVTSHSEATTVLAKTYSVESPADAFPASQIPSPLNEDDIPRSDAPSPDESFAVPQTVCVVDGLWSVRSPKGHKVLVGVELSPRVSDPVPSPRRTNPPQSQILVSSRECAGREEVVTTVVACDLEGNSEVVATQIKRTYSFETDYPEPEEILECVCTCPSPVDDSSRDLLNVLSASSEEREFHNAVSASSEERDNQNLASASSEERDYQNPVSASSEERDFQKPVSASSEERDFQNPVSASSEEPDFQNPASASSEERDFQNPASASSEERDFQNPASASSEERDFQNPASASSEERDYQNARSGGGSSSEELKSGTTSPFYSPTTDSPDMTITQSTKMDKESSANILLAKHWGPEREVEICRQPNTSLGISIVGGKVDLYNSGSDSESAILGIFIKNVIPNSPAGQLGELKTGDRILEVDSTDLRNASHERAVEVIRRSGSRVRFLVQSLIQWNAEGERSDSAVLDPPETPLRGDLLKARPSEVELARTPSPVVIQEGRKPSIVVRKPKEDKPQPVQNNSSTASKPEEDEDSDDDDEYRDMEGKMFTAKGFEIYRASAGNVRRSKEDAAADPEEEDEYGYTSNKVKKKYGSLGDSVLVYQLERNHKGLGISLAGHKDRTKMAVYVCGLNPQGSAAKNGGLQVGDEILEVNGVVLQGRCHLNASAIIKGLPGPIFKVIVHRREASLEDLAVKPITHFPVTLDDETPEQKYAKFKGLKTVTIKKGTQGLGIMIIEGKHAEVGQGIFISDIQEGSAAEQAGLVVGDMILSVNSDTLLGSNYDSAASLLKKTEGVVTLVVCNPNKAKEEEAAPAGAAGLAPGGTTPARSPTPTKAKEEKRLLPKPFSSLPPPKSPTPTKSLLRVTDGAGAACAATPKTSPALSVRFSGVGPPEEPPPDPLTCAVTPGKETIIEFPKEKGLGVTIVGGTDTPLGCVLVSDVYPEGAVAKDGRLQPGDQLLEVDTEDFRKATHSKALQTLRQCLNKVKLLVYREERQGDDLFQVLEVDLVKKPGKGLGLSVIGRKDRPGVSISEILHGGAAEADARLLKGDVVFSVNGQDLKSASQEAAAAVLKAATGKVVIKVGRLKAGKAPSAANGKPSPASPRTVSLTRDGSGLGFSIVGGHGDQPVPVLVKTIFPEGAAARSGLLHCGDQLLAVDDMRLEGLTHEQVVALLKRAPSPVRLRVVP